MPYADFQPSTGRDFFGDNVSLMSRLDANQRANQQAAQQEEQFQILKPAIVAKTHADIVSAGASIANQTRMENLRSKAAMQSTEFNDEFINAISLADFSSQSRALSELQGKIAYMEILPEYKGFVTAVNDARAKAHMTELTNMKLDEATERARMAVEGRVESANVAKQKALEVETLKGEHATTLQGMKDTSAKERDTARASTQAALVKLHQRLADPEQLQTRAAELDELASTDPAQAETYKTVAQQLRDRATRVSQPKKGNDLAAQIEAIAGTHKPDGAAAKSSTPAVPKGTKTIKVDGKDYPTATDANGNRAYFKDGKWIEIPAAK